MDWRFREPTTGYQTLGPSRPRKYSDHLRDPIRPFRNARDAGLVLLNVPYAAVGGILALLITNFNFSISAGIGFIALFGICIQNGVIMISDIKNNLRERHPLEDSIKMSVKSRVRSVLMTAPWPLSACFRPP